MLSADGSPAPVFEIVVAFLMALIGIVPLAAGVAGYFLNRLNWASRAWLLAAAVLILYPCGPIGELMIGWPNYVGFAILTTVGVMN